MGCERGERLKGDLKKFFGLITGKIELTLTRRGAGMGLRAELGIWFWLSL